LIKAFSDLCNSCGFAASRAVRLCLTVSHPKMIGGYASGIEGGGRCYLEKACGEGTRSTLSAYQYRTGSGSTWSTARCLTLKQKSWTKVQLTQLESCSSHQVATAPCSVLSVADVRDLKALVFTMSQVRYGEAHPFELEQVFR